MRLFFISFSALVLVSVLGLFGSTLEYYAPYRPFQKQYLVTAYSELDSCHYKNCAMANGERAHEGAIACPRHFPLGTQVLIEGVVYECKDRYHKDLSDRFDIFVGYGEEAHERAKQFGARLAQVEL